MMVHTPQVFIMRAVLLVYMSHTCMCILILLLLWSITFQYVIHVHL